MRYSPEFFHLNLQFGMRAAALAGLPVASALAEYTPLYPALGLGTSFDPEHPVWQRFVAGLVMAEDPVSYTYAFYLSQRAITEPWPTGRFGPFSYAVWDGVRVRLHFYGMGDAGRSPGPLHLSQVEQRRRDLSRLLTEVREIVPEARTIVGGSWLYNLDAYRRLFPPGYLATAQVGEPEYQYIAQWGQFVRRDGSIRKEIAARFLASVAAVRGLDQLRDCFPFPVLRLEGPIEEFYGFYEVG